MPEEVVLDVERVLHLVELLGPTDHVGHHNLSLSPGQVLVDPHVPRPELAGEVVGQAQQLGETNNGAVGVLLLDGDGLLDGVLVVGGNDNLAFRDLPHDILEVGEVVVGGGLEVVDDGVFVAVLFGQFGLLNDVGPPYKFGPEFDVLLLGQSDLHLAPIDRSLQIVLDSRYYVDSMLIILILKLFYN